MTFIKTQFHRSGICKNSDEYRLHLNSGEFSYCAFEMEKYLDIESWNRKQQFYFFKDFDNPFFNICANLDLTELVKYVKSKGISFFQASLYLSLKAANEIESFRYRLRGDKVIVHNNIHGGSTILNEDETFSYGYFDYFPNFGEFEVNASERLAEIHNSSGQLDPKEDRDDMIYYSMIPWISFTSFSHARAFNREDSIPKIVFGKYFEENQLIKMPVSVEVHHSLMDGIHVGKFFDLFQKYLDQPQKYLEK